MTKKLVGLFASVALLSSGMALANNEGKDKGKQTQSSQQMGGDAYGGAGQQGHMQGQTGSTGQMQGQMGASNQMMGEKQVSGTVVKSSKDKLSLKTDNGIIDFKVDKQTKFQDPSVKQARDLKEGQQVRTGFEIQGNQNVAKSISLDTSNVGGSGMGSDTGINQQPSDTGGSGLDQPIDKDNNLGGTGDVGGDVGGSGDMSGHKGDKTY
jgi:NADPH:quinone reductase-like Zn-dependent oxidoreductase